MAIHLVPRSGDELTLALPWRIPLGERKTSSTVDALVALVQGLNGEADDSPLNLKLGYQLREELSRMGSNTKLVKARLVALSDLKQRTPKEREQVEKTLRLPLFLADTGSESNTHAHPVVNLLLLARFLRREGGMQVCEVPDDLT